MTSFASTPTPIPEDEWIAAWKIYQEIDNERHRARSIHQESSMEMPMSNGLRLAILVEEVGEVAKELCVGVGEPINYANLREELIQVAAMAAAWAEGIK